MGYKRYIFPLYGILAFLGGTINGLIGVGGGIIMTFILRSAYKDSANTEDKDVFASALISVLPMTILTTLIYSLNDKVVFDNALTFVIPSVLGGLVGAVLLQKINSRFLSIFFSILLLFSGVMSLIK